MPIAVLPEVKFDFSQLPKPGSKEPAEVVMAMVKEEEIDSFQLAEPVAEAAGDEQEQSAGPARPDRLKEVLDSAAAELIAKEEGFNDNDKFYKIIQSFEKLNQITDLLLNKISDPNQSLKAEDLEQLQVLPKYFKSYRDLMEHSGLNDYLRKTNNLSPDAQMYKIAKNRLAFVLNVQVQNKLVTQPFAERLFVKWEQEMAGVLKKKKVAV